MVAIYVLKLVRGKYYVGLTRRNIDRILDHLDGDGAAIMHLGSMAIGGQTASNNYKHILLNNQTNPAVL